MTLGKILKLFVSINEHAFIVAENFLCTVKNAAIHSSVQTPVWPSISGSVCSCYTNHSTRPSRKRTCLSPQNQGYSEATHHYSEATQHCWVLSKHLSFATHCFTSTFCCSMFRNLALLSIFVAISTSSYCIWDYDLRVRSCWFNIYFSHFERTRNRRAGYHPIHPWWDLLPVCQASAFSRCVLSHTGETGTLSLPLCIRVPTPGWVPHLHDFVY